MKELKKLSREEMKNVKGAGGGGGKCVIGNPPCSAYDQYGFLVNGNCSGSDGTGFCICASGTDWGYSDLCNAT